MADDITCGMDGFMLIALTPETPVKEEPRLITALLNGCFSRVHIRHPKATLKEVAGIIEAVPAELRGQLTLHDCMELADRVGGIHLNSRNPYIPAGFKGLVSRSCHSEEEVADWAGRVDYATLSPVFDSISKSGYSGKGFSAPSGGKVIALGGITPERLVSVRKMGYAGAAMLGAIPWDGCTDDVIKFCKTINHEISKC